MNIKKELLRMKIDVELMESQRHTFIQIQKNYAQKRVLTKKEQEAIDGIVNMLDYWSDTIWWNNQKTKI